MTTLVLASEPVVQAKKPSWLATWWAHVELKFGRMRTLDEDNEALRAQVAQLELENSRLRHESSGCAETKRAEKIKKNAKAEGGVEHARTIASLGSRDTKLLKRGPKVIHAAALKAFAQNDFETAAKAFVFLAESPERDEYQTPATYFLSGVSLFKLGNYKKANEFFSLVVKLAHKTHVGVERTPAQDDVSYAPRALSWMAMAYGKLGEKAHAEYVIQELLQKYPKSKEARTLNRRIDGQ